MDNNDRQAIQGLFSKLGDVERQAGPRDAEAERFIADSLNQQPGAPYYMAQTIVMQDMALANQQKRIEELERAAQSAGQASQVPQASPAVQAAPVAPAAQAAAAPEGGGMFSRIFGGGAPRSVPSVGGARPGEARPGGAWGNAGAQQSDPQTTPAGYAPQGRGFGGGMGSGMGGGMGGGGFLAGAAQTAMGVAGGVILGNAIGNMFGGHEAQAATPAADATPAAADTADADKADTNTADNTADNNTADTGQDAGNEPEVQNASDDGGWFGGDDGGGFDDGGFDDGGFDDI